MKTKNIICNLLALGVGLCAYADTIYWTGATKENNSWGHSNVETNWSTNNVPSATDNIIFDASKITGDSVKSIHIEKDFTVNDYIINSGYGFNQIRLDGNLNINGNFEIYTQSTTSLLANSSNANAGITTIKGNLIIGQKGDTSGIYEVRFGENTSNQWGGWGGPTNVNIGGNIELSETSRLYFNVGLKDRVADYANPDINVGGVINFNGNGSQNPNMYIINAAVPYSSGGNTFYSQPLDVVIACNGLNGNGVIGNNSNGSLENGKASATILLRNDSTQTFQGWIQDGNNCTTKIVMNATGTQILTSGTYNSSKPSEGLSFTGGVEMISGTLQMNYTHQINHGNLDMKGGKFMNMIGSSSKNVNFTNLNYSAGTIVSRIDSSGKADVISLSGGLIKNENFSGKFLIQLTGDFQNLIDNPTLLISWDNIKNATEFTAEDFTAIGIDGFDAIFSIKDDGLYISLNQIPEPSTIATIFGALALTSLIFRRRK